MCCQGRIAVRPSVAGLYGLANQISWISVVSLGVQRLALEGRTQGSDVSRAGGEYGCSKDQSVRTSVGDINGMRC